MNNPELDGVENPAIEFLKFLGWRHLEGKNLKVESRSIAPIIKSDFSEALQKINPWMNQSQIDQVEVELRKAIDTDLMTVNKSIYENFIQKMGIQVNHQEGERLRPRSVSLIDSKNISNNTFTLVNQFVGNSDEQATFRPDILLFVNGLPMGIIECKASHHRIDEGIGQVIAYQNRFPKHFYFNQLCIAINRVNAKYGAINTPKAFYFDFKLDETEMGVLEDQLAQFNEGEVKPPTEQDKLLWGLLEPTRIVDLIRHMVLFEHEEAKIVKKLPRYQQWRAVNKCVKQIKSDQGGVVWHTQGSGKSLTMALLARKLHAEEIELNNPSILILTDRTDLDRQIFNTFCNVGLKPEQAQSVIGLKERLSNDYGGIFTSTIHKFQESDKSPLKTEKESSQDDIDYDNDKENDVTRYRRLQQNDQWYMVAEEFVPYDASSTEEHPEGAWEVISKNEIDFHSLSTKPNFYVLVDEAHRSHYGFLGAFMRQSLPNAKLIAFTGTPLLKDDKDAKNTLREFGGDGYIDVYALQQAVSDGFTLPIKLSDGIPKLKIDNLLDADFDKKTKGMDEQRKAKMAQELIKKRKQSPSRLRKIAEHLTEHYLSNARAKGFKAMLVCSGRPSAVKYKEIFDELMRERKSNGQQTFETRVVISLGSVTKERNDSNVEHDKKDSILERVQKAIKEGLAPIAVPTDEIPNFVNKEFKLPFGDESQNTEQEAKYNNVGLIIVSDMLLTGYDAPILSTLYLDKALKDHTLLQAIARVNRTKSKKTAGYIVDYYGVVDSLDIALKMYGGEVKRGELLKHVSESIPQLQASCQAILDFLPKKHDIFKQSEAYKNDAEFFLNPVSHQDKAEDFLEKMSRFSELLDLVLPHPDGAPFKPYYIVFRNLKSYLANAMRDEKYKVQLTQSESDLLDSLLEEHVKSDPVKSFLNKEIDIFNTADLDMLKDISQSKASLIMKNQLKHTIQVGMNKNPGFFGSLESKLNELINDELKGRMEQTDFLRELDALTKAIHNQNQQAQAIGFSTPESIITFNYLNHEAPQWAQTITEELWANSQFTNTLNVPKWSQNPDLVTALRNEIRNKIFGICKWDRGVAKQHADKIVEAIKEGTK